MDKLFLIETLSKKERIEKIKDAIYGMTSSGFHNKDIASFIGHSTSYVRKFQDEMGISPRTEFDFPKHKIFNPK